MLAGDNCKMRKPWLKIVCDPVSNLFEWKHGIETPGRSISASEKMLPKNTEG